MLQTNQQGLHGKAANQLEQKFPLVGSYLEWVAHLH